MKLYVRIKFNGKWTFRAACPNFTHIHGENIDCSCGYAPTSPPPGVKI